MEQQYLDALYDILVNGNQKGDRTGTGTISKFGGQMRFKLNDGFPLFTTKFTPIKLIASELLWFIAGKTNIKSLLDDNNHIWDGWSTEDGELGNVYGAQWRSWKVVDSDGDVYFVDQLLEVIDGIKNNPNSRRHIISAWNPADLPDESISPQENVENGKMALAPCHYTFQFYVANGELSCMFNMRSSDTFLGLPFNVASYALLTHMIAKECGLGVGDLIYSGGDIHIYNNHIEQVIELLTRKPKPFPTLWLNPDVKSIFDYSLDDIKVENYEYHPAIKAPVAI